MATGLMAARFPRVLLARAPWGLVAGMPGCAGMAPILSMMPVLTVLGVVVVLPWVLVGGLVVVMVGVLNRGSLLRRRMAAIVPGPLRPCLPGLIKPVCLLLTQMIGFGNQKQTTVSLSLEAPRVKPCNEVGEASSGHASGGQPAPLGKGHSTGPANTEHPGQGEEGTCQAN